MAFTRQTIYYHKSGNQGDQYVSNLPVYGFEDVEGRFNIGNGTTNDDNVWKTFKNGGAGLRMDYGQTHIWPSYRVQYIPGSFIYKAWSLSNWGHMQGDYQYLSGTFTSPNTIMEFDSAGGYGHFTIEAKESSMWHPLDIVIRVESENKEESDELFSFTRKEAKWYKYDNGSSKDISDSAAYNSWNSDYYINSISKTKVALSDGSYKMVEKFLVRKNSITTQNTSKPLGLGDYDFDLWYNVPANNYAKNSSTAIYIEGYYDERVGFYNRQWDSKYYHSAEIKIGTYKQKPNILYYVNMAWVQRPTSYNSNPAPITSSSVEYSDTTITLYLYVEFGISPNGGADIYWNQELNISGNVLDATLPSDLSRYIEITLSNNDSFNAVSKYSSFVASNYGGNYFKVVGTSVPNNEANNDSSRYTQDYSINNVVFSPSNEAGADDTDNKQVITETLSVSKTTTTSPWKININAKLQYNKYKGETAGQAAGSMLA